MQPCSNLLVFFQRWTRVQISTVHPDNPELVKLAGSSLLTTQLYSLFNRSYPSRTCSGPAALQFRSRTTGFHAERVIMCHNVNLVLHLHFTRPREVPYYVAGVLSRQMGHKMRLEESLVVADATTRTSASRRCRGLTSIHDFSRPRSGPTG